MSGDAIVSSESRRAIALRGALGTVTLDQRLRVHTTTQGELRGYFRAIDGETLLLARAPNSEQTTSIPLATILGVDRVASHAATGAGIAAVLAAIPFLGGVNLANAWNSDLHGLIPVALFVLFLGVGLVVGVGAIVGAAFDKVEPLVVTRPRQS